MMTSPPSPSGPADLAPSVPDAGMPPDSDPSYDAGSGKSCFTLTPESLAEAGLQDAQVGQTYSAQVQFTITDNGAEGGGTGAEADIASISEVTPIDAANEPGTDTGDDGSSGDVENSLEAGSGGEGDESPVSSPSASDDAEEKMLGYKRKKNSKPSFPVTGLTD